MMRNVRVIDRNSGCWTARKRLHVIDEEPLGKEVYSAGNRSNLPAAAKQEYHAK